MHLKDEENILLPVILNIDLQFNLCYCAHPNSLTVKHITSIKAKKKSYFGTGISALKFDHFHLSLHKVLLKDIKKV